MLSLKLIDCCLKLLDCGLELVDRGLAISNGLVTAPRTHEQTAPDDPEWAHSNTGDEGRSSSRACGKDCAGRRARWHDRSAVHGGRTSIRPTKLGQQAQAAMWVASVASVDNGCGSGYGRLVMAGLINTLMSPGYALSHDTHNMAK